MTDLSGRLPGFASGVIPVEGPELTVKTGQTIYEGEIVEVLTATPTIIEKGGDDAGVAFATVALQGGDEGETVRIAHPDNMREYGPYTYVPGSVSNALIKTKVCVADSGSVDLAGNLTNDVPFGVITRPDPDAPTTKVFVQMNKR